MLGTKLTITSCDIVLGWMPQNTCDDKSTLVQVMAWCYKALKYSVQIYKMNAQLKLWGNKILPDFNSKWIYNTTSTTLSNIKHLVNCIFCGIQTLKFCVKFQRAPLKFHTKFWTHIPQNMHSTDFHFCVWFTISLSCDVISHNETIPSQTVTKACEKWYNSLDIHFTTSFVKKQK